MIFCGAGDADASGIRVAVLLQAGNVIANIAVIAISLSAELR